MAHGFTVEIGGESSVTLTLSEIQRYRNDRNLNWWYKLSTESTWHCYAQTPVSKSFSGAKSMTITDLVPNRLYNFSVSIYSSMGSTANYTKLDEKFVNGKTAAANGTLVFPEIKPNSVTVSVDGLVPVNYWREVKYYYRETGSTSWIYRAVRQLPPAEDPYTEEYELPCSFTGLKPETQYDFAADLSVAGEDYYRTCQGRATTTYNGLSLPEIFSTDKIVVDGELCHTVTPPGTLITLTWWVPPANVVAETIGSTTFRLYYKRDGGEESLVGEWANDRDGTDMTVFDDGTQTTTHNMHWGQADIQGSGWLGAAEDITVRIEAIHNGHKASSEKQISVTRYFYWDTEKKSGDDIGLTANEWNRMVSYVNASAEMYPGYFVDIEEQVVAIDDAITSALVNEASQPYAAVPEVVFSQAYPATTPIMQIYNDGLSVAAPDWAHEPLSLIAYVTINGNQRSGSITGSLVSGRIVIASRQEVFAVNPIVRDSSVVITCASSAKRTVATFDTITAEFITGMETMLQKAMKRACGN